MARRNKKRWADMSGPERVLVVVGGVVQMALLAAALADINRRPAEQIRGSKRLWTAASFVNFAGPIAYFSFGVKRRREIRAT